MPWASQPDLANVGFEAAETPWLSSPMGRWLPAVTKPKVSRCHSAREPVHLTPRSLSKQRGKGTTAGLDEEGGHALTIPQVDQCRTDNRMLGDHQICWPTDRMPKIRMTCSGD